MTKATEHVLTRELLETYLGNPPTNSRIITYTPEMAQLILDEFTDPNSRPNRGTKPKEIARYTASMKAGRWALNGETVVFRRDGILGDGQNRMLACVRANAPFTAHTIFGIEPVAFFTTNIGRNRSAADMLTIAGYTNAAASASCARWVYRLTHDPKVRSENVDPGFWVGQVEMLGHPKMLESISAAMRVTRQYRHPPAQLAALHLLMARVDAEETEAFFEAWASGAIGGRAKGVHKMQSRLHQIMTMNHGRIHELQRLGIIVKAWKLFRANQVGRGVLDHNPSDPFPAID